jgi:hypothetical protein
VRDIEEIPVETVSGDRPLNPVGERLLIGLAALALLGGVLIAGGNLLTGLGVGVADASPSATAAETPRPGRTERPTPSPRPLRELTLEPGEPPEPAGYDYPNTSWLEALAPIEVWSYPDDGEVVGRLAAGEIVIVDPAPSEMAAPGWYVIQREGEGGWIRAADDRGEPLAHLLPATQGTYPGGALALAAGPNGFVGRAWAPGRAPEEPKVVTLVSVDGEQWATATDNSQAGIGSWGVAWGPSGWLAATIVGEGNLETWIWESSDGRSWTPLGELPIGGEATVQRLVASAEGYVMIMIPQSGEGVSVWYSPDGISWQESGDLGLAVQAVGGWYGGTGVRVLPVRGGYLAWVWADGPFGSPEIAWSRDARSWETIPIGTEELTMLDVVAVGDDLLAVAAAPDGRALAWRGRLTAEGPELVQAPHLALAFDGVVATALVSDGERAYAFGYRRADGEVGAWVSDGTGWGRLAPPEGGFGTIPRVAAAGPAGVVVAGARLDAGAQSPVFWHLRADGSWVREPSPAIPQLPEPECPAPPERALDFMALEPSIALACFGDRPMTLVAWSAVCEGCWEEGEPPPGSNAPAQWLQQGQGPYLLLLPTEGDGNHGWWRQGILHPDLEWTDAMAGSWLRVTGHFDDAAARRCGAVPPQGVEAWWYGREADVLYCRWQFVVTDVEVLGRDAR